MQECPPLSYEDEMYLDKSPEYWAGWALAYYQWYTCRTFTKIHKAVSLKRIVSMYDIYHEMDITHFIDTINELWDNYYKETNLKRLRKLAGFVPTRIIRIIRGSVTANPAFRTTAT